MWRGTLPEILGLVAGLAGAACTSDHHVSPWGTRPGPALAAYAPRPDLPARLAAVDAETAALRLRRTHELPAQLPRRGGPVVIRGYDGEDLAGRPVHAVRVAVPLGVVLALGPLDPGDLDRRLPTELVPESGGFRSGMDLNGDGRLDLLARAEDGSLGVLHFDALGSGAYEVAMAAPPRRLVDVDGDGRADLEGELPVPPGDPIAPRFTDVATFAAGRYANDTPAARAEHARRARIAEVEAGPKAETKGEAKVAAKTEPKAGTKGETKGEAKADAKGEAKPAPEGEAKADTKTEPRPEVRLRAALERGWHRVLAREESAENVLRALRREPVPASLQSAFERALRAIARLQ